MTTFKRFLTLSLMTVLTAFSVQVWGTEATLNSVSTKDVATTVGASVSLEFDGVTCTCTRHSTNQPGFYTSSGIVRYYSTDVMTLSVASGNTITQIDFVMTSGTVGTASPGTLTGISRYFAAIRYFPFSGFLFQASRKPLTPSACTHQMRFSRIVPFSASIGIE